MEIKKLPVLRIPDGLNGRSGQTEGGLEPLDVALAGGFDVEDEKFRGLVAVEVVQAGFQCGELIGTGLEEEKGLDGGFDAAFPMED
jgi:hypothetical protein